MVRSPVDICFGTKPSQAAKSRPLQKAFVVPYDKPEITRERFLTDDPSGVMDDAQETVVDGTPAKSFFGYNDQMGATREVWFIKNGFLYEVTIYKPLAPWLTDLLPTWHFL
jgi:hypothetical protein